MAEDSGGQLELEPLPSSSSVEPAGCVAEGVGAGRSSSSGSKLAEAAQGGMESPVDAAGLEAGPSSISSSISSGALGLTDEQQQQGAVEAVGDGEGSGTSAEQEAAALPPPPRKHGMAAALFNVAQGRWKRVKNAMAGIKRHAPRKSIITLLVAAFNSSGAAMLAKQDSQQFQLENKQALVQALQGDLGVALVVEAKKDLKKINYAQQGDATMYTQDMLSARHDVRSAPEVIEATRAWWRWLPKANTRMVVVGEEDPDVEEDPGEQVGGGGGGGQQQQQQQQQQGDDVMAMALDQPIYSAMVVLVTLVLLPKFGLKADNDYDPSEDWTDDNKGLPYMAFPNFFDAMFELADMWAEGVGAPAYADLLQSLLAGCQELERKKGTFGKLLKKFGHKPKPPRPPPRPKKQPQEQQQEQHQPKLPEQPVQPDEEQPIRIQQDPEVAGGADREAAAGEGEAEAELAPEAEAGGQRAAAAEVGDAIEAAGQGPQSTAKEGRPRPAAAAGEPHVKQPDSCASNAAKPGPAARQPQPQPPPEQQRHGGDVPPSAVPPPPKKPVQQAATVEQAPRSPAKAPTPQPAQVPPPREHRPAPVEPPKPVPQQRDASPTRYQLPPERRSDAAAHMARINGCGSATFGGVWQGKDPAVRMYDQYMTKIVGKHEERQQQQQQQQTVIAANASSGNSPMMPGLPYGEPGSSPQRASLPSIRAEEERGSGGGCAGGGGQLASEQLALPGLTSPVNSQPHPQPHQPHWRSSKQHSRHSSWGFGLPGQAADGLVLPTLAQNPRLAGFYASAPLVAGAGGLLHGAMAQQPCSQAAAGASPHQQQQQQQQRQQAAAAAGRYPSPPTAGAARLGLGGGSPKHARSAAGAGAALSLSRSAEWPAGAAGAAGSRPLRCEPAAAAGVVMVLGMDELDAVRMQVAAMAGAMSHKQLQGRQLQAQQQQRALQTVNLGEARQAYGGSFGAYVSDVKQQQRL